MAERRMFAKTIIDSDAFLEMPMSSQALYFHLSMRADDEGFINNARKIARMIGASDDDLKILITKRFIIPFDSGIVVIKHWRLHNYIRKDRSKDTVYKEERDLLTVKPNGSYTMATTCQPNDNQWLTQDRLGKDRLGKDSVVEEEDNDTSTNLYGSLKNVYLTPEEVEKLNDEFGIKWKATLEQFSQYMDKTKKQYSNHYGIILKWTYEDMNKEKSEHKKEQKNSFHNFEGHNGMNYDELFLGGDQ